MRPVYEGFWKNLIFLREGGFVQRSILLACFALGNLNIISTSSSYDVVDGIFAVKCGIFRARLVFWS